jgi:hypothetical protein
MKTPCDEIQVKMVGVMALYITANGARAKTTQERVCFPMYVHT